MTFASVSLPVAEQRWRLDGPAGSGIDTLVAGLIGAGVAVEPIVAGTAYRLDGHALLLGVLGDELKLIEGFDLQREAPPADRIDMRSSLAPSRPALRSITVHGTGAASSFVARAIDRRLAVAPVGVSRFAVNARTADLVDWLAAVLARSAEDVMALFGWTPESVAAEDAAVPTVAVANLPTVQVNVTLPDRKTTSEIGRNAAGEITQVIQFESTT